MAVKCRTPADLSLSCKSWGIFAEDPAVKIGSYRNFLAEKYKNDTKVKSFVDKLTKCQDLEEFLDNAQKNSGRLLNLCRQKKS